MPRLTIDEINARRAAKPASGGSNKRTWRKLSDISANGYWRQLEGLEYLKLWVERKRAQASCDDEMIF